MSEVVVQSVGLSSDGIELQYLMLPDDVRCEGQVVLSRSLAIAYTSPAGLGEAAVDLRASVEALALLAQSQLDELPVFSPPATDVPVLHVDDDEDEDVGMGDGR